MFVVGAGMELFMIKTGFYEIVTRKEAERRLECEYSILQHTTDSHLCPVAELRKERIQQSK